MHRNCSAGRASTAGSAGSVKATLYITNCADYTTICPRSASRTTLVVELHQVIGEYM
jgi:hypothetical protein